MSNRPPSTSRFEPPQRGNHGEPRLARRSGGPAFIPQDFSRALADVDTNTLPAPSKRASRPPSRPTRPPLVARSDTWITESPTIRVDTAPPSPVQSSADRAGSIERGNGARLASGRRTSPWLKSLALAAVLLALVVRAGIASAAFIAPGGDIAGWSRLPVTRCVLCGAGRAAQTDPAHPLTPAEYAATLTGQLSLDDALGQMMMVQFVGLEPTPDAVQMVNAQHAGGILFFGGNIASGPQIAATTAELQRDAPIPLLMAVDQEGGPVNRFLNVVGPLPAAATLANPAAASSRGAQDASILQRYGFNLDLAPVVDVGTDNPELAGRTFGDDPTRVATMAGAYLNGLQQSGRVAGTLKHFPGLGATSTDPHIGLPLLSRSRAEWEATDLAPYRLMLAQGNVRAIMVSHEMLPAIDSKLPTSLSPAVVTGVLRDQLGYDGVIVTDSLYMGALNVRWSIPQAAVLAVVAGSDLLIGPYNPQIVDSTLAALKQAISSGTLTRARIDASVRRILTLKLQLGLIPMPTQSRAGTPTPAPSSQPTPTPAPSAAMPSSVFQASRARA